MVRLKDIARQAGVSVMTVSKVLRDAPDISAATKVRIRSLAQQMGYVPDSMAQSLRTGKTRLFGLVLPLSTHPVYSRVVMAIEERAHAMGYDLLMAHSLNTTEREEAVIRRMLSRRVDGLFLAPVYRLEPTASIYEELARRETPTVILGPGGPFCRRFPSAEVEDEAASCAATEYLLKLGHRRIVFLAGPTAATWAHLRLEGYRRALREAGIDRQDELVFNAGSTIEEGERAASQMLAEGVKATAIYGVNDLVAIGAEKVLIAQGLRIPEQVSLLGFGNILLAEHCSVPLTTMHQPKHSLGSAAMDLMTDLMQGKRPGPCRLPARLVVRASTAPPPPN